ncbi:MAG TPA: hypothetical protein VK548_01915 [Candidatus Acidoferrum sp.]|nr:hypothetical protein [Candidatus Acidoferrum sp.]
MRHSRWPRLLVAACVAGIVAGCAGPWPHRPLEGRNDLDCTLAETRADERCLKRTPEISTSPAYRLHFVELDDQGWLYPVPGQAGYTDDMGSAHAQIDRVIDDLSGRLAKGERVMLFVFVHGWKHGAGHDDRDVQRFREILSDVASMVQFGGEPGQPARTVMGIYISWRGGGTFAARNPLVYTTFWTRKNAALHVSGGAARELFARLTALRVRWNAPAVDARPEDREAALRHPQLRTVVLGHSFGGWIAFSSLSISILEQLAHAVDADRPRTDRGRDWRSARVRATADMVVLLNPAFEATRYQPLHSMAQRAGRSRFEAPVLVIVTSTSDGATRTAFPLGRRLNTLFQRSFVSADEEEASVKTPGFVPAYRTHRIALFPQATACEGWRPPPQPEPLTDVATPRSETRAERLARTEHNVKLEVARHRAWLRELETTAGTQAPNWSWEYCGKAKLELMAGRAPHVPVWNITTDASLIRSHSDIMQEPLHAFLRQLYMTLSY